MYSVQYVYRVLAQQVDCFLILSLHLNFELQYKYYLFISNESNRVDFIKHTILSNCLLDSNLQILFVSSIETIQNVASKLFWKEDSKITCHEVTNPLEL